MSDIKKAVTVLPLPIWGLPTDTDVDVLNRKASSVAQNLESLGCYRQRDFAPAHTYLLTKAKV